MQQSHLKGELIARGYCVHQINKAIIGFEELAEQQRERPISIQEIEAIEPFSRNDTTEVLTHKAIKETTIGMRELLRFNYVKYGAASDEILRDIILLNKTRNRLHLMDTVEFQLFKELVSKIRRINEFVEWVVKERIIFPNT